MWAAELEDQVAGGTMSTPKTSRNSGERPNSLRSDGRQEQEGLWKLTSRWKSAKNADSHSGLKRASQTTLGFFTVPTGSTIINSNPLSPDLIQKVIQYNRKLVVTTGCES